MSTVEDNLAALGLSVPDVAAPAGSYVPALRHGNLVYTSGQIPAVGGELQAVGKVGAEGVGAAPPPAGPTPAPAKQVPAALADEVRIEQPSSML